ncbi:MAG: HAD-IA family hydrolase [Patescibacteria group bacterium]|nr:HAD-IA family hydrolase [Patescibacteria group bacterium]
MDEQGLGTILQEARQKGGLTQQQLCQRANISFSTLTKIERGAIKSPSIFTVQSIAAALELSLDEMLGLSPVKSANTTITKTRSGVSFIYFDVNGCLVHFYQRAFVAIAQATGAPYDAVQDVFWRHNSDACQGTMSISDFNRVLAERLGVESIDWAKYYLEAIEPIQQMQDLLIAASKQYRIGLLTNIMPGLLSTMFKNEQLPNVKYEIIIDSSQVGAIKPDNTIYEIAQKEAGVPANEILLIDDDRINLMSAENFGWHAMEFDDARIDESIELISEALKPAN